MDRRDSPKRSNSGISKSKTLASSASQISVPVSHANGGLPRVHTVTAAVIHCISDEHSLLFDNKVVLGFEEEFTLYRAKAWVRSYNLTNVPKLEVFHELPNALFVVQFNIQDTSEWPDTKRSLLAASPLGVGDIYASVNDYSISFDPCSQRDFKHLVTVNIPIGNPAIFSLIRCIVKIVGSYVKGCIGPDLRHISLIVESQLKLFPARGQFKLGDSAVTTVFFDYEGRNLRCSYCFSYRHFPSSCQEPRPDFFNAPELKLDSEPTVAAGVRPLVGGSGNPSTLLERPRDAAGSEQKEQAEPTTGARKAKAKRGRPRDWKQIDNSAPASSSGTSHFGEAGAKEGSVIPEGGTNSVVEPTTNSGVRGPQVHIGDNDTNMVHELSPFTDNLKATALNSVPGASYLEKGNTSFQSGGVSPQQSGLADSLLSFDKVTTRKRDRSESDINPFLVQNLNAAFSLESPRPFKRIQRPTTVVGPAALRVIGVSEINDTPDGVPQITKLKYAGASFSPSTSERSYPAGEPTGSA